VQVIPHVTNEIKARIHEVASVTGADVVITEIGGTVGDIEGLPFLEAIRQFRHDVGVENVLFIHVTLIPYIKAAGELKTKPTQQSVAKLREIGIAPDILICRAEHEVELELREKIAMFCNIERRAVIECRDVEHSIYEAPLALRNQRLDDLVCEKLRIDAPPPDLTPWRNFVHHVIHPGNRCRIAVVGKYIELQDAYKSIYEAIVHAGAAHDCGVKVLRVDAEDIEKDGPAPHLGNIDGILIPGGFGDRGTEGKILAAGFARENGIPYFGICLGMQIASIEFARSVCGLAGANSTEFDSASPHPVICLLEEQENVTGKGGNMRLGTWQTKLQPGTLAHRLYGRDEISERHRHRYEFNQKYRPTLKKRAS
jgi:CTP synthase